MKKAFFWALLSVVLAGCATGRHTTPAEINSPETSLLFGYMDMTDAPSPIDDFNMKVVPTYDSYYYFEVEKGLFYHAAVPPGTYQLNEFSGTSTYLLFFHNLHRYSFLNPDAQFKIAKPDLYFLGSFKYLKDKDTFKLTRIQAPTEAELLRLLLPKVKGTKWETVVVNRLGTLGVSSPGN